MRRRHGAVAHLGNGPRTALGGFGHAVGSAALRQAPEDVEGLRALMARAAEERMPVAFRGAGRSYGDAALNGAGLVIDTQRLDRVLAWDPATGVIDVEPGATIETLWRHTMADGYWPWVVPGTMFPTIGGCVAMNIHGKNHFRAGPFGEHVQELDLLTPAGELLRCSPSENAEIFRAVVGGFGMLGATTRVRLGLHRVHSGNLRVEGLAVPNLEALFDAFEARLPDADYLVGWTDCFARGAKLGRSVIHAARHLEPGEDPDSARTLDPNAQDLPSRFFGVIPRGLMWRLLRPWINDLGVRLVNTAKFTSSRLLDRPGRGFLQSHVAFAFLLDYVPRWRDAYGLGGFIQVQPFVPAASARQVIRKILTTCHDHGIVPYLGVFKRHRADAFLLSHALDGYSMAMDFRVTARNRERVWKLGQAIGDIVVEAGGRFYFAKDAVARPDQVLASFGAERVEAFAALKRRLDPDGLLTSELSRRVLPDLPALTNQALDFGR